MNATAIPAHLANAIHLDIILQNARRIAKREYARSPNWVLTMNTFGLGSTYAFDLCRTLGYDPEATTLVRTAHRIEAGQ